MVIDLVPSLHIPLIGIQPVRLHSEAGLASSFESLPVSASVSLISDVSEKNIIYSAL